VTTYPVTSPLKVNWANIDNVVAYADFIADQTGRNYTVYRVTAPRVMTIYSMGLTSNEQREVLRMRNEHGARLTVVWRSNGDHTTQPRIPDRQYFSCFPLTHFVKRAIRSVRRRGVELTAQDVPGRHYYYVNGRRDLYGVVDVEAFWLTTKENHKHFVRLLQEDSDLRMIILESAKLEST
jgi:hypothetical protein